MENRSFWGSGRPRAAQKLFKKVGGFAASGAPLSGGIRKDVEPYNLVAGLIFCARFICKASPVDLRGFRRGGVVAGLCGKVQFFLGFREV